MNQEQKKEKKKRSLFHKAVNVFLYFFLILFGLLVIAIGITQTSTFREWLRKTIIEEANSSINGHLNIGKIDGTFFTSLIVRNASLTYESDTVIAFNKVEIKLSPLKIFFKEIFVRELNIKDVRVKFIKDSSGALNISKVFPPSEEDTTSSEFPFNIKASSINIENANFTLQDYRNVNSDRFYDEMNMEDLRVQNLNLSIEAYANINEKIFNADIKNLSFQPNLNNFILNHFSSRVILNKNEIQVQGLNLVTNKSNVKIDVSTKDLNIFSDLTGEKLRDAYANLKVKAENFNFEDLAAFVPAVNILKGEIAADISIEGKIGDLAINNLRLNYLQTDLNFKGKLLNLDDPSQLYIQAGFEHSKINYSDINILLPSLSLPSFKGINDVIIDTLMYEGHPIDFKSNFTLNINSGKISGKAALDLSKKEMIYSIALKTNSLNLFPVINATTSLNLEAEISGKGTEPSNINSIFNVVVSNSNYEEYKIKELNLKGDFKDKLLDFYLDGNANETSLNMKLNVDFSKESDPVYKFNSSVTGLNFSELLSDSSLDSRINFTFNGEGKSFNPELLNGNFLLNFYNSKFAEKEFAKLDFEIDIKASEEGDKRIKLISTLADISVDGNFNYSTLSKIINREIENTSIPLTKKINQYISGKTDSTEKILNESHSIVTLADTSNQNFNLKYNINFKNLSLLSFFIKEYEVQIEGTVEGEIKNSNKEFVFNNNLNFDFFKFWSDSAIYFSSDLIVKSSLSHASKKFLLEDISFYLTANVPIVYIDKEIRQVVFNISLSNSQLNIYASANYNNLIKGKIDLSSDFSREMFNLNINKLFVNYSGFEVSNRNNISITFVNNKLEVRNFNLYRGNSEILLNGFVSTEGYQDLYFTMKQFRGYDLSYHFLNINPEDVIDNNINLTASIKGTFDSPQILLNLSMDSINYKEKVFGSLACELNYDHKIVTPKITFKDATKNTEIRFSIYGNVPIDLSFSSVDNRLPKNKEIDLTVSTNDFDLAALGDALPYINNLKGIFNANLKISGTWESLNRKGMVTLRNSSFIAEPNNIEYGTGIVLRLEEQTLYIDSLVVANMGRVKNVGMMRGRGKIEFDGLKIRETQFLLNGDLTVLTDESRAATQSVYGNLYVSTQGDIIYATNRDKSILKATINVNQANLVFPQTESGYSSSSENFIYKYVADTSIIDLKQNEIQRLIALQENRGNRSEENKKVLSGFDYDIRVKIKDDARITFILAKEANQRLIADLKGELEYSRINEISSVQGELKLLEGSTLEFIKTFGATGSIVFESDLVNPNLNIVAVYKNMYKADNNDSQEEEVAVKIKLKGRMKDLAKNFSTMEDNIAIYRGAQNISNDVAETTLEKADALWFIITGKFTKDVGSSEKSGFNISGTATSVAGSILGSLLNTYLGDYVRSFELQSGTTTKFNISGNIKNLKYTFGGTTNTFQDISHANIRLEYPLIENLIIRFERRDPLTESSYSGEMINELALKYRFEF